MLVADAVGIEECRISMEKFLHPFARRTCSMVMTVSSGVVPGSIRQSISQKQAPGMTLVLLPALVTVGVKVLRREALRTCCRTGSGIAASSVFRPGRVKQLHELCFGHVFLFARHAGDKLFCRLE